MKMKKLIMLMASILFTTALMAQADQKATGQIDVRPSHDACYTMKDGVLMHIVGDKMEVQKTNVKLAEGTTITTNGNVTRGTKDSEPFTLRSGQCIDMKGKIGDYAKLHPPKTNVVK